MSLPNPPSITKGQIALDPVNGIVYYKDGNEGLIATTWSWLRDDMAAVSTNDDVTITGNLTVSGTTVSVNVESVTIADNILILNSNVTGSPTENAGIEVERGTSTNVSIRWNESNDRWEVTNDGTTYYEVLTTGSTTLPASVVTLTGTQTLTNKTLTSPVITGVSPTITLGGDLSGSVTLTDLGSATLNATVINNSVALGADTTGEYVSRLAAGSGITVSNNSGESATPNISIDTSIVQTRVADISDTEIGYLNGVTSAIQTQFNSKAPTSGATFTGTTTLPSTTSIGNVSDTEIGYLDGVTSAIQTQLDSKQPNFIGYDYEIHVSQVDGNDTTGNGDLLTPVASITKALTLVTSQRKTVIIHPGTYTESPSITTQYTTLTGPGLIGGNIVISGTVSTNTGCTVSGIKMTNLTVSTPTGQGNVNILNCEVSGTFTKSSNTDYTVLRLCDLGAASITGAGLTAIFGGNPNFVTVNNASANVIVKSAVTVAPVLTAGTLSIVDCVVGAAVTNAVTSSASSVITLANSQFLTSNLSGVAPVVLNGFYSILNCVYDKPSSTLVASSGTGGTTNAIDYFQYINADKFITQGGTSGQFVKGDGSLSSTIGALDDLTDVNAATPSSDQVLTWDSVLSTWINKTFSATVNTLDAVGDVTAPSPSSGDYLKWNGTAWVNDPINLGTDTVGNYMSDITAGTGVSVTHTPGEGSSGSISIGQSVGTSDSVTFNNISLNQNGSIIFEGSTGDSYETTLTVIDPTADHTVSLPNATDTLVGKATTDTLTNKTLDNPVVTGRLDVQQIREKINNITIGSVTAGTLTCDYSTGGIFYVAAGVGASTFTIDITNLPTDNNYAVSVTIMVKQGATQGIPNTIKANGTTVTHQWANGNTVPTASAQNKIDIFTLTLHRVGDAWIILGNYSLNY